MAELLNATLAAKASSAELAVTPLAPLALNASAPCQVLAKNTGGGGASWGLLYDCKAGDDTRIIYPTSALIKVVAGEAATRVLLIS